jgi:lysozyme
MKITKVSSKGLDIIKKYEGFSSKPYLCPSKVITIGYGSTYYEDGSKVKLTDSPITQERATELLEALLVSFERAVDSYCIDTLNQNQFDSLVSFAYNCGVGNLKSSTLLRKVNVNPNNPTIKDEFLKWTKGGGKTLSGLVRRRTEEAQLYFS